MHLSTVQQDRAIGALLGCAAGDALGAGCEFHPPRIRGEQVAMVGGGGFNWAPGEWTDDTSMAVIIARVAATGADLRDEMALDRIVRDFVSWSAGAPDVGVQTSRLLRAITDEPTAAHATETAVRYFRASGKTGNGSLMRTAPVALRHLGDDVAIAAAARAVSALTHGDEEAGEACALWCVAISHAVLDGTPAGIEAGLALLPAARGSAWRTRLAAAETRLPHEIPHNGWVVAALQAAWSALQHPSADLPPLPAVLDAAVRAGDDTDTVAAIAGSVAGALHGGAALPAHWQKLLHGWPGLTGKQLAELALQLVALAE